MQSSLHCKGQHPWYGAAKAQEHPSKHPQQKGSSRKRHTITNQHGSINSNNYTTVRINRIEGIVNADTDKLNSMCRKANHRKAQCGINRAV